MKSIPMIFNQEMVKALVDVRKTVTRRPMKLATIDKGFGCKLNPNEVAGEVNSGNYENSIFKPGDLIWVRETFRQFNSSEECGCSDSPCGCPNNGAYIYKENGDSGESKWKPSIHMPRIASRLTLRVTGVRCERINNITDESAIKEGLFKQEHNFSSMDYPLDNIGYKTSKISTVIYSCPVIAFKDIWDSIYSNWDKNPWVWVIEFEVMHKNVDEVVGGL